MAGVTASVLTIPVDAIKTRIQTDSLIDRRAHSVLSPTIQAHGKMGVFSTGSMIYHESGMHCLC